MYVPSPKLYRVMKCDWSEWNNANHTGFLARAKQYKTITGDVKFSINRRGMIQHDNGLVVIEVSMIRSNTV